MINLYTLPFFRFSLRIWLQYVWLQCCSLSASLSSVHSKQWLSDFTQCAVVVISGAKINKLKVPYTQTVTLWYVYIGISTGHYRFHLLEVFTIKESCQLGTRCSLVPRPHLACFASNITCGILKMIRAGFGFGSGTETRRLIRRILSFIINKYYFQLLIVQEC